MITDHRDHKTVTVSDRATNVQHLADAFCDAIIKLIPDECETYYLHCIRHHVADLIRICPCDLSDASGSAIEHYNLKSKRLT